MFHQPADIAKQLNVSAFTIRRWCDLHAMHLSSGANPKSGRTRRLDDRDMEVLRTIAQLRAEGCTTEEINERIANIAFAVPVAQDAPPGSQDSHSTALAQNVGVDSPLALQAFVGRLDAIERAQKDRFTWFLYGFLACGVIFGLMLLLAVLYGR